MTLAMHSSQFAPDEAPQADSAPSWLWDPAQARILWANAAFLDYCGGVRLDDLLRLRFRSTDGFARRLARLAREDLSENGARAGDKTWGKTGGRAQAERRDDDEPSGRRVLISFPNGEQKRLIECLCANQRLASGESGLLLRLVSDQPDLSPQTPDMQEAQEGEAVAGARKNGAAAPQAPQIMEAETGIEAEAQAPPEAPQAPEPEPDNSAAQPRDGFYGEDEAVDEEDLLTLQEIARMINDEAGFPLGAAHVRADECDSEQAAGDGASPSAAATQPGRAGEHNYFLESLPAGVAISMGGRLARANRAFLLAFGFESEWALRKAGGLARLFPQSRQGVLPLPSGSPAGGERLRMARLQMTVEDGEGRQRLLHAAFRNVSTGHEPVQIIIIDDDRLNVAAAEAEDSAAPEDGAPKNSSQENAAAGEAMAFLAEINHEVRTPLNSIIGFSELMKDASLGQNDVGKFRDYAEDIHQSAMHALSLINDLLDVTKIMARQPELDLQPLDLNKSVADGLQLMQAQIEQKKLRARLRLADDLPLLRADRRKMKQIILNLLSNSVKFTPPGGRITLSTRKDRTGGVILEISDTGVGMSRGQIQRALQPFRQLEKALKRMRRQQRGSGLGLPLTKALAEAHGASFKIDGAAGLGLRISLHFPAERLAAGGG